MKFFIKAFFIMLKYIFFNQILIKYLSQIFENYIIKFKKIKKQNIYKL